MKQNNKTIEDDKKENNRKTNKFNIFWELKKSFLKGLGWAALILIGIFIILWGLSKLCELLIPFFKFIAICHGLFLFLILGIGFFIWSNILLAKNTNNIDEIADEDQKIGIYMIEVLLFLTSFGLSIGLWASIKAGAFIADASGTFRNPVILPAIVCIIVLSVYLFLLLKETFDWDV